RRPDDVAEERRLFYVGMTRARRHLSVTWSSRPSRFLTELGVAVPPAQRPAARAKTAEPDDPVYAALKRWRLERASADEKPPYVVQPGTPSAAASRFIVPPAETTRSASAIRLCASTARAGTTSDGSPSLSTNARCSSVRGRTTACTSSCRPRKSTVCGKSGFE